MLKYLDSFLIRRRRVSSLFMALVTLIAAVFLGLYIFEITKKEEGNGESNVKPIDEATPTPDPTDPTPPVNPPVNPPVIPPVETSPEDDTDEIEFANDSGIVWSIHITNIVLIVLSVILNAVWYPIYGGKQTRNEAAGLPTPWYETTTFWLLITNVFLVTVSIMTDWLLKGQGSFFFVLFFYGVSFIFCLLTFLFIIRTYTSTYRNRKRILDEASIAFYENFTPENAKAAREFLEDMQDLQSQVVKYMDDNPLTRTAKMLNNPGETASAILENATAGVSNISASAKNALTSMIKSQIENTSVGEEIETIPKFEDTTQIQFDQSKIKTVDATLSKLAGKVEKESRTWFRGRLNWAKTFEERAKKKLKRRYQEFKVELSFNNPRLSPDEQVNYAVEEFINKNNLRRD